MGKEATFTPLRAEHSQIVQDNVLLNRAPEQYRPMIKRYAAEYGLPVGVLASMLHTESRYKPGAQSPTGAMGLAQIMPDTWRDITRNDPTANPYNPEHSIKYGAQYLSQMVKNNNGDIDKALAAYNWGPGNVRKMESHGGFDISRLPTETRDYIMKTHQDLGQPAMTASPSFTVAQLMNPQSNAPSSFNSALKFEDILKNLDGDQYE